jgi:16S rRNA (cytidine1402-2'-O)-methyltransferase
MPGTLFVVATPIGNLEDITGRALRVLREASIIAAEDTRRTAHLLARYAITTPSTSLHEHNEAQKSAALVGRLERGENIALVSDAGTPTISDPGSRLIRAAIDAGIRVESIPGPNAAVAALAVSGFPGESFSFLGFPPARSKARSEWFERVKAIRGTIVFFEAPHRIIDTLAQLQKEVGNCDVVVCRELTKLHEELVRGPISAVLQEIVTPLGEFTVVANIGQSTEIDRKALPGAGDLLAEFGELTKSNKLSRRAAMASLAKRHKLRANVIYELIETAKKSGRLT